MTTTFDAPSTCKVRRDATGGKRGDGHVRTQRVRRPDPRAIHHGRPDPSLTGVAGLAAFGAYLRGLGVDRELGRAFFRLKPGPLVVYPMAAQMRLLLDSFVAGEARVFGLESLAADPLFVHLAGGIVPSIDTVYRDLRRFDDEGLAVLEAMVAEHGLVALRGARRRVVHLDIDSTVEPIFADEIEGAVPGPNPRYPGRPSYHPVLARIAETDTCVGALLRPGDTAFGVAEASLIGGFIDRVRGAIGPKTLLYVRIDAAGDCAEIMSTIHERGAFFLTKGRMTPDLCGAISHVPKWRTVDRDADGKPTRQVAEIEFARGEWTRVGLPVRVIAVRSRDRDNGKRVYLWDDLDFTVQVFLTNDVYSDADELAHRYDGRAGIEPLIAEFKTGWGIGKVPTNDFDANHAALLLKVLAHNLVRRYVADRVPTLRTWRVPWLRRALFVVPGRLVRSGRRRTLRIARRPALLAALN